MLPGRLLRKNESDQPLKTRAPQRMRILSTYSIYLPITDTRVAKTEVSVANFQKVAEGKVSLLNIATDIRLHAGFLIVAGSLFEQGSRTRRYRFRDFNCCGGSYGASRKSY